MNGMQSSGMPAPVKVGTFVAGALILAGCAMEHGGMEDPSSVPIAPVATEALYVVNGGSNSISVIDVAKSELIGTINLRDADYPHHIHASRDGGVLALAIPGMDLSGGHAGGAHSGGDHDMGGAVMLLNASTGETKASRRFGSPNHNAAISPDGTEIWTTQMAVKGKVLVLDAGTLATERTLDAGNSPAEVTFTVDGKYAFVANGESDDVMVFDAGSKALVKTIAVGETPVGAWPGNDTVMYVDNEVGKSITAIHGKSLEVVRNYALGFTPGMAATDAVGDLWVTDSGNGKVVVFAAGSTAKSGEAATGSGAHGIAFSKDGKTAFISNQAAGTVSVLDVAGRTVKATVTVGKLPNGMVVR